MLMKLRHDVAADTSRRSKRYVPTQCQLRRDAVSEASWLSLSKVLLKFKRGFFELKVRLTSIFGDKKTKKEGILSTKIIVLFCQCIKSPKEEKKQKSK